VSPAPRLSLGAATNADPGAALAFLHAWRPHADELVVAVDERAHPDTAEACRAVADQLHVVPAVAHVERYLGWMLSRCSGEWILRMDDDELPSAALIAALPDLVASRSHTHFWLPRRWVHPVPGRFLAEGTWLRDLQVRLLRNVSGLWRIPGAVHTNVEVAGASRVADAPFLHLTTLLDDVDTRRRRARSYEELLPGLRFWTGERSGSVYLPEDLPGVRTEALPAADAERARAFLAAATAPSPPAAAAPRAPTVGHDELDIWLDDRELGPGAYAARIRLVHPLEPMPARAVQHVQVEVVNAGDATWPQGPDPWPPLAVGHRWLDAGGAPLDAPNPRAAFTERVAPGATTRLVVPIQAPAEPGEHTVAVDVVHEFVRWFGRPATQAVQIGGLAHAPAARSEGPAANRLEVLTRDLQALHDTLARTPLAERYWMWGGLLLGWAREGRPLAHDLHDADFGFSVRDGERFATGARALMAAGFEPLYRFRNNAGQVTQYTFARNDAKFEFFAVEPHEDRLRYHVFSDGDGRPLQALGEIPDQPTEPFRFLGRTWRKHVDHEAELAAVYGDWRTPDAEWAYMADRALRRREPWHATERAWSGELGDVREVPSCTP
jgi:hypothetical protein